MYDTNMRFINMDQYSRFFWKPLDYKENVVYEINKTLSTVKSKFSQYLDAATRQWWDNWAKTFCPVLIAEEEGVREQSTTEYVKMLSRNGVYYRIPLKMVLTSPTALEPVWRFKQNTFSQNKPGEFNMVFPIISLALNPVENDMNRVGGPPTFIMTIDQIHRRFLTRYRLDVAQFYRSEINQGFLISKSNAELKDFLRRKVSYDGVIPTLPTGNLSHLMINFFIKKSLKFCNNALI